MDPARSRRRTARAATVAVVATATCLSGGFVASPAFADEDHVFTIDIEEPDPVAPGGSGLLSFEITNTGDEAVRGVLMNVSLPRGVTLHTDAHCQETGHNPEGGQLISCNFSDAMGRFAPGETRSGTNDFAVSADAPASADLGRLGALVVPLEDGEPTEDWTDIEGDHVDWVEISTAEGAAGTWGRLKSLLGF